VLLGELAAAEGRSLGQVLREGALDELLARLDSAPRAQRSDVTLLPPVADAQKIICVGLNYADHIAEMNRPTPEQPVIFTRFNDTLVGSGEEIVAPKASEQFDYEGEFTIVVGKGGRRIPADRALEHVFGYTIMNDGSVRDYQRHTHQFTPGKNFPRSGSLGPEIVTADEFGPVGAQRITTRINGEVVQESSLDQLVFGVADLIAYCSQWTELAPGDLIATGTPGGVGDGHDPKRWLRAGETLEVEVEGVGVLRNPVVGEA
jgi:2-keto-4-pentenoate hydratase/2-oxohepta-3-ene-1,7-dioic acid hydratase in catechol pathway